MHGEPDPDPDRRGRLLRAAAILGVGALAIGSCSGMLLGRYTVTGMDPFYTQHRASAWSAAATPAMREDHDWPAPLEASAAAATAPPRERGAAAY